MSRKQKDPSTHPDASLAASISLILAHPEGNCWYWDAAADEAQSALPEGAPQSFDTIEAILAHIPALAERYSAWQVATGCEFIFNNTLSSYAFLFGDERIEESRRVRTIANIFDLFNFVFRDAANWSNGPAHLARGAPAEADPIQEETNRICFMFWDSCPLLGLGVPNIRTACIDVMEHCLTIPNYAVQESALHGLGHLAHADRRAARLAADFAKTGMAPLELIRYAQAAATGNIL